jgi:hypothetical protein
MTCKYCGRTVKATGGHLTYNGSSSCAASPSGKHVIVPEPGLCVYCGRPVKSSGGRLTFNGSSTCSESPTKKHLLAE